MTPTVLLVGGFGLPPLLLQRLADDLGGTIVPTGFTIGCGEVEVEKVLTAIDGIDGAVVLVGHSRGGQVARVAAVRRPSRIAHLVTAGTPRSIGPPNRWGVSAIASLMRRIPNPVALDCATADCCVRFRADLEGPLPTPWTAVVSARDRIVPRYDALTNGADEVVEIDASHVGLVMSARGRAEVVRRVRCGPSARCRRDAGPT